MARHLTLLTLLLGLSLSAFAQAQQSKLPPCPAVDYSKNVHLGEGGRTGKWHNCFGRYIFEKSDGTKASVYEGEFKDGKQHGKGTYTLADNIKYVGEFRNGLIDGQGTLTDSNGTSYAGEFKDFKRHGKGLMTYPDGSTAKEGIWADDKFVRAEKINLPPVNEQTDVAINEERKKSNVERQAQSKLPLCPDVDYSKNTHPERIAKWTNCYGRYIFEMSEGTKASVYEGEFKGGKKHGNGTYTYNGGKYVGEYKDGKMHGQGTHTDIIGGVYKGDFKDGMYNGQGTYTSANGDMYVGEFKYSYFHGRGIQTYAYGSPAKEGIWADGKFVRAEKVNLTPVQKQTDVAINEERKKLDADRQVQSSLPPCPSVDNSKNTYKERISKWHNCYGKYAANGHVIEGEFRNGLPNGNATVSLSNGDKYIGEVKDGKMHGQGIFTDDAGSKYIGDYKNDKMNGQGIFTTVDGSKYVGEWKEGYRHGKGILTYSDGVVQEGIWGDDKLVRAEKVILPSSKQQTEITTNEERNRREQAKQSSKLSLQTTTTMPDANGAVTITIRTNTDTSSLKVNGEEQGGRPDGNYTIKRVARVGQDTQFTITAVDIIGNTDATTITVARQAVSSSLNQSASLKPESIKRAPSRDAVAIIIGIQNYKRVPKAEFANADAKEFYEYAIRGLGIKPENIKLLLDEEADEVELYKAFQNWLPLQVTKNITDVYVFYSGHGLPAPDGKSLYFLPHGVDKQFIEKTAVSQQEVIAALVASKPKSVTMFIDACYSGQTRSGEMMIASVRPLAVKSEASAYPSNFTVISASSNDQYSSSSPELKHGIFSFYLMKGMEGDADGNKDGKITAGEMQEYLQDKVSRQAMSMSRKQDTQLVGDANKVLMGVR